MTGDYQRICHTLHTTNHCAQAFLLTDPLGTRDCAVEHLPGVHRVLGLMPSTENKKNKNKNLWFYSLIVGCPIQVLCQILSPWL